MKKKLPIAFVSLLVAVALFEGFYHSSYTSPGGAPSGVSGSPADGKNCTSCHQGTASPQVGWITSNVGSNGYVPGTTYTITATVKSPGKTKFGFEISPQSPNGTLQGTLIATNTTQTQLVGSGKYITHKSGGTSGTDPKTWTFNWTAPAKGTGAVTFYGSLMAANGSGSSGDLTYTSTLVIPERVSTGIVKNEAADAGIRVYPVPAGNTLTIEYAIPSKEKVEILLTDLQGRLVEQLLSEEKNEGSYKNSFNIHPAIVSGHYLISIKTGKNLSSKKVIIQH